MNIFIAYILILVTCPLLYTAILFSESFFSLSKKDKVSMISTNDGLIVMKRLGLWPGGNKCNEVGMVEGAYKLLEEKEASFEELEEAFGVFDEDGDGVISANELRNVMRRLGLREGSELEECKRMIGRFDLDGDGRIGFKEFKCLLEQAS